MPPAVGGEPLDLLFVGASVVSCGHSLASLADGGSLVSLFISDTHLTSEQAARELGLPSTSLGTSTWAHPKIRMALPSGIRSLNSERTDRWIVPETALGTLTTRALGPQPLPQQLPSYPPCYY
jgi:hypothetical protein